MRNISVLLFLLGLSSLFGVSPYLEQFYATHRPASADVASGYVYEHHIRGGEIVFISQTDSWARSVALYGGALLGILGGLMFERSMRGGRSRAP
jgi:hypothetical protein